MKTSLKEVTPTTQQTTIHSNENKTPPLTEHESRWTIKSTIVTAYTQGKIKSFDILIIENISNRIRRTGWTNINQQSCY